MKPFYAWVGANKVLAAFVGLMGVALIIWLIVYLTRDEEPEVVVDPLAPVVDSTVNYFVPTRVVPTTPTVPTVPSVPLAAPRVNQGVTR